MVVKFTRSGLCDDPWALRGARQCATHAALGPLDGALGAKKCYMHFLPRVQGHLCVAVVSDTEEQGPQGTNYMEQICSIVDGTYLACKGRFHVCGCISQLYRIEILVCVSSTSWSLSDEQHQRDCGAMCHTLRREKVLTAISSGFVPQKDNPSWPSWF